MYEIGSWDLGEIPLSVCVCAGVCACVYMCVCLCQTYCPGLPRRAPHRPCVRQRCHPTGRGAPVSRCPGVQAWSSGPGRSSASAQGSAGYPCGSVAAGTTPEDGSPESPWAGLSATPTWAGSGTQPWGLFLSNLPNESPFCGHVNKGQGRGRWLSSAYGRLWPRSMRHSPGRLVRALRKQYSPALWDGGGGTESSYCEQRPLHFPT